MNEDKLEQSLKALQEAVDRLGLAAAQSNVRGEKLAKASKEATDRLEKLAEKILKGGEG